MVLMLYTLLLMYSVLLSDLKKDVLFFLEQNEYTDGE